MIWRTINQLLRQARVTTMWCGFCVLLGLPVNAVAEQIGRAVQMQADGSMVYESDTLGNRLPDFSSAGYGGGGVPLPQLAARLRLMPHSEGDDTQRIQAAIDHVSALTADAHGLRGGVVLSRGEYRVAGQLRLHSSGVVLRGEGSGPEGSRIIATGKDRRTLIVVAGVDNRIHYPALAVVDEYVPVGAQALTLDRSDGLNPGDRIRIERPATASWIEAIGMHVAPARTPYQWREGKVNLMWDRMVTAVNGSRIELDAPISTAIEARHGAAQVYRYQWQGRIRNVGIENLRLISAYEAQLPADEDHAWMAIQLDAVEDAWVTRIDGLHWVSSLVDIGADARRISVMDCRSMLPVSENAGYRRHTFHTRGQQTLFVRCYAEYGRHDFTAGYFATGPNVFLDCEAVESTGMSGSIGSWASGLLFDNVNIDGGDLALDNLEIRYGGVGWAAANSVLWQCSASRIICRSPPGALNLAIGVWGEVYGDGRWQRANENFEPRSLYQAQLQERNGPDALQALVPAVASGVDADADADVFDYQPAPAGAVLRGPGMRIENGWLVDERGIVSGGFAPTSWWRGNLMPTRTAEHHVHLTRFLPGRIEQGATEDLESVAERMLASNHALLRHHWGLWYDRRREDHQMIRRANADAWPPFYEMPWARSGIGKAWDGLSKYDLERFNPWYFMRLRDFAEVARDYGRVLFNEMYFQHNILEAGAHWADFPWRPANALQDTGFSEPPEYAGGKRVFMAAAFYDVSHPVRRELHRNYIRHSLANLAGQPNVIHSVSEEFTGPLHFVEFWLDVVAEWIAETGHRPLIALSAPKDVQDAILQDPLRGALIDVVEFKYWYQTDNGLFAPDGGQQLAPRQHQRLWRGGRPSAHNIAAMIREYRSRYPGKAIICNALAGADGWSVLLAGGSIADLPFELDARLRRIIPQLQPQAPAADGSIRLSGSGKEMLLWVPAGVAPQQPLANPDGSLQVVRMDRSTGCVATPNLANPDSRSFEFPAVADVPTLYWITQ